MTNIEKNLTQILATFQSHVRQANNIGVFNAYDIIDNYVDCFHELFECDYSELQEYLYSKYILLIEGR